MYRITVEVDPMGRPRKQFPSLCRHKASGQAVVYLDGETVYLGPWGSKESVERYGEILAGNDPRSYSSYPTIGATIDRYVAHKRATMPKTSGEPRAIETSLSDIRAQLSDTPLNELAPARLIEWRDGMIARGLSMSTINKRTNYLLSFVRWSSVMGFVTVETWSALKTVDRLKPGRSAAKPPKVVEPVAWEHVEKTLPHLSERMRDLILVQSYTGARSGELVSMTRSQIDPEWVYRPRDHKTSGRGHQRAIPLGPKAREIVERRLQGLGDEDRVFGSIHVSSISHEVAKACIKAEVPKWTPHQLRHRAATIVLSKFGIAAARSLLGHSSLAMTSRYAKPDLTEARKAVDEIG